MIIVQGEFSLETRLTTEASDWTVANSFAERLHRGPSVVHVVPNQRRYTSFRLRRSEYMCVTSVYVCALAYDHPLSSFIIFITGHDQVSM